MLAVWPLDERPAEMCKPEVVNSLTFDQMVTYKKLYDARMKKEGKGEEVFGRDAPIPETRFEAGVDDCAEKLHPARYRGVLNLECRVSVSVFRDGNRLRSTGSGTSSGAV
jgi:hypothetical protein